MPFLKDLHWKFFLSISLLKPNILFAISSWDNNPNPTESRINYIFFHHLWHDIYHIDSNFVFLTHLRLVWSNIMTYEDLQSYR